MPNVENHVRFCVKAFGERNRELCYMVNSWMDAPSRRLGSAHRKTRHDIDFTPFLAIRAYGDCVELGEERIEFPFNSKNRLIASMVLQHLRLDGLITPEQERTWTWEQAMVNVEERRRKALLSRKREARKSAGFLVGFALGEFLGIMWTAGVAHLYGWGWWVFGLLYGLIFSIPLSFLGGFIASVYTHEGPDDQHIKTYAEKICQINKAIIANQKEIAQYFKARMTPTGKQRGKQSEYKTRIERPDLSEKVEKWLSFWNNTWTELQRIRPPSIFEEIHNDLLESVNLGRQVLLEIRPPLQESLEDPSDENRERAIGAIKKFQIDAFQGRLVDVLRKIADVGEKMNDVLRTLN